MKIKGAAELEKKLQELPKKVSGKIARQALRAGAKVVQRTASREAPRKTGLLSKAIKVRAAKRSRGRIGILVQTAAGFYKGKTFYGAFVEFGHKRGKRTNAQKRAARQKIAASDARAGVPANPFMKRAYEAERQHALEVIEQELWAGIEREAKAA